MGGNAAAWGSSGIPEKVQVLVRNSVQQKIPPWE
jgi:hypothetical protein